MQNELLVSTDCPSAEILMATVFAQVLVPDHRHQINLFWAPRWAHRAPKNTISNRTNPTQGGPNSAPKAPIKSMKTELLVSTACSSATILVATVFAKILVTQQLLLAAAVAAAAVAAAVAAAAASSLCVPSA